MMPAVAIVSGVSGSGDVFEIDVMDKDPPAPPVVTVRMNWTLNGPDLAVMPIGPVELPAVTLVEPVPVESVEEDELDNFALPWDTVHVRGAPLTAFPCESVTLTARGAGNG